MSEENERKPLIIEMFYKDVEYLSDEEQVKIVATCKKCSKKIMGVWKPKRVTSNFNSHIKICSPKEYNNFHKASVMKNAKRCRTDDTPEAQSSTKFMKLDTSESNQNDIITQGITEYLITSMRPISEVENEGFIRMWKKVEPNYKLPTLKTMRNIIQKTGDGINVVLKEIVERAIAVGCQCNIWTNSRTHGFFGLCLTIMTEHNVNTRLVACRKMAFPHTTENINSMYGSLLEEFKVEKKVMGIVTDNVVNPIEGEDQGVSNKEEFRSLSLNWADLQEEFPLPLPPRYGCVAHILQLIIKDGLAEMSDKITKLIEKCSAVVAAIHQFCEATTLFELKEVTPIPMPNASRWNSMYAMIDGIIKAESQCEGILMNAVERTNSKIVISFKDMEVLKEVRDILSPFSKATEVLQADSQPTSGMVIPAIIGLQLGLENVNVKYAASLQTGLQSSLTRRCETIRNDSHFIIASALDPRFKLNWVRSTDERRQICNVIELKGHAMAKVASTTYVDFKSETIEEVSCDDIDLFSFMENSSSSQDIDEFESYLSTPTSKSTNCIQFWEFYKEIFPKLYFLHLKHHVIPATSAMTEKVFNPVGLISDDPKNRLDDKLFEFMLVSKCNSDLF